MCLSERSKAYKLKNVFIKKINFNKFQEDTNSKEVTPPTQKKPPNNLELH